MTDIQSPRVDRRRTDTRDKVAVLVRDQRLDVRTTALKLGVSTQTVYKHLKRLGITPPEGKAS